jgi:hypothetical protein
MITGLVAKLVSDATVGGLIGSRCYVNKAPQGARLPYLILTQLDSEEYITLDATTSNLRSITVDIDCKGRTFVECETLTNAVKALLTDYVGAAGSYVIGASFFQSEVHDYEPAADGGDAGIFVITLDFDFQFNP